MMSRWNFILFGGDPSSPIFRRMCWRLFAPSFILGFAFGFTEPDPGATRTLMERQVIGGLGLATLAIFLWEGWVFYRRSDELARHVLAASLSIAACVIVTVLVLLSIGNFMLGWPNPQIADVAFGAYLSLALTWFYAAWKST